MINIPGMEFNIGYRGVIGIRQTVYQNIFKKYNPMPLSNFKIRHSLWYNMKNEDCKDNLDDRKTMSSTLGLNKVDIRV